jgi:hypothetical protein
VRDVVTKYLEPTGFYSIGVNSFEEATKRLAYLKDVIENKGGHRIFYVKGKAIHRESDLQLLYRLVWFATPSVVSREVNDGRGPADFQVARGPKDKTLVEFKLAKNSQLAKNLQEQSGVYERASDATHPSLKCIVYFSRQEERRVTKILQELDLTESPQIVLIDARPDNKPSGSVA